MQSASSHRKWPERRSLRCRGPVDHLGGGERDGKKAFILKITGVDLTLEGEVVALEGSRFLHFGEVEIQEAANVTLFVALQSLLDDRLDESVHSETALADRFVLGLVGEEVPGPRMQTVDRAVVVAGSLEHHGVLAGSAGERDVMLANDLFFTFFSLQINVVDRR